MRSLNPSVTKYIINREKNCSWVIKGPFGIPVVPDDNANRKGGSPSAMWAVLGSSELIVDVSQTGLTLKANKLRELRDGIILKSQACIFTSKKNSKKKGLKNLVRILSK